MDSQSPLLAKSYAFALNIVGFCEGLRKDHQFVLCDQLLKSGTSIGANIEEATQAYSRNEFASKLSISLKEAHEARYWLRIIHDTGITKSKQATEKLIEDAHEIIRMLVASLKTTRSRV